MPSHADENAYAVSKIEWQTSVDGQNIPIRAYIREPFEMTDDRWICATTITGLFHRKADVSGKSPEQAISEAQRFLKRELAAYVCADDRPDGGLSDKKRLWRLIDGA